MPLSDVQPSAQNDRVYRPVDPSDPEFRALVASVREHGVKEPLVGSRAQFAPPFLDRCPQVLGLALGDEEPVAHLARHWPSGPAAGEHLQLQALDHRQDPPEDLAQPLLAPGSPHQFPNGSSATYAAKGER